MAGLEGAVYEVRAAEDISTPDGTLRYSKGEVVDTITTSSDGFVKSKELYLGKYEVKEITAPDGMVVSGETHTVELTYAGQNISVTETSTSFYNERKMWGKRFQVVVTTHLNTKHLHCHFVINSVSFADGKRLKDKEKSWYYFRHIADEICLEHKLSIVEKPELHRSPAYLTMKDEAGMPTRYNNAKKAIDEAIAMSRNLRQFQYELGVMGYHSNFSPNRKYATVTPKGSEKPIRTYRLGEEYTKEKILERLIANRDNIVFKPFQPKTYIVRQYRLPTRESKIQKVGGLYGLYLYYCYRLGYLPKHNQKQQNTARLHYLLKDDLMKMDELTKQVTLLGKHQIGTDEQLFSYKRSVEDEIKTLTADRTHLRNEIRKVDISDERLSAAKIKISAISERLKELRKEVKLCDGIAKRSGVIADTLSQVKAEEEKSQRKESRNYEQRR